MHSPYEKIKGIVKKRRDYFFGNNKPKKKKTKDEKEDPQKLIQQKRSELQEIIFSTRQLLQEKLAISLEDYQQETTEGIKREGEEKEKEGETVFLNLAGSVLEIPRPTSSNQGGGVGGGSDLLSVFLSKRWARYLPHDRQGRLYLDMEKRWLLPLLSYYHTLKEVEEVEQGSGKGGGRRGRPLPPSPLQLPAVDKGGVGVMAAFHFYQWERFFEITPPPLSSHSLSSSLLLPPPPSSPPSPPSFLISDPYRIYRLGSFLARHRWSGGVSGSPTPQVSLTRLFTLATTSTFPDKKTTTAMTMAMAARPTVVRGTPHHRISPSAITPNTSSNTTSNTTSKEKQTGGGGGADEKRRDLRGKDLLILFEIPSLGSYAILIDTRVHPNHTTGGSFLPPKLFPLQDFSVFSWTEKLIEWSSLNNFPYEEEETLGGGQSRLFPLRFIDQYNYRGGEGGGGVVGKDEEEVKGEEEELKACLLLEILENGEGRFRPSLTSTALKPFKTSKLEIYELQLSNPTLLYRKTPPPPPPPHPLPHSHPQSQSPPLSSSSLVNTTAPTPPLSPLPPHPLAPPSPAPAPGLLLPTQATTAGGGVVVPINKGKKESSVQPAPPSLLLPPLYFHLRELLREEEEEEEELYWKEEEEEEKEKEGKEEKEPVMGMMGRKMGEEQLEGEIGGWDGRSEEMILEELDRELAKARQTFEEITREIAFMTDYLTWGYDLPEPFSLSSYSPSSHSSPSPPSSSSTSPAILYFNVAGQIFPILRKTLVETLPSDSPLAVRLFSGRWEEQPQEKDDQGNLLLLSLPFCPPEAVAILFQTLRLQAMMNFRPSRVDKGGRGKGRKGRKGRFIPSIKVRDKEAEGQLTQLMDYLLLDNLFPFQA